MRRSGVLALLMLLALWLPGMPVSAGKGWCRSDPIVRINGTDLQIWVAIPIEDLPDVLGPIQIELVVPRGSINELVYVDEGFNGFGEAFRWAQGDSSVASDGSFTVTASVSVPIRNGRYVPMQVELIPSNGIASAVYGETVGVEIDVTLHGSRIAQTTVRGASVTGAPATGGDGQPAIGGNAVGGLAVGAGATGTWVSTRPSPSPSPASETSPDATTPSDPAEPSPSAPAAGLPDEPAEALATPGGTEVATSPAPEATPDAQGDTPDDASESVGKAAEAPSGDEGVAGAELETATPETLETPETPASPAPETAGGVDEEPATEEIGATPPADDSAGQAELASEEQEEPLGTSEAVEDGEIATPSAEAGVPEPSPDASDDLASADPPAPAAPANEEPTQPGVTVDETPAATPDGPSCPKRQRDESDNNARDAATPCVPETHDSHKPDDGTSGAEPDTAHEPEASEEH